MYVTIYLGEVDAEDYDEAVDEAQSLDRAQMPDVCEVEVEEIEG